LGQRHDVARSSGDSVDVRLLCIRDVAGDAMTSLVSHLVSLLTVTNFAVASGVVVVVKLCTDREWR
jgi:hypothetical protein